MSVPPTKSVCQEPDSVPFFKDEVIIGYERALNEDMAPAIRCMFFATAAEIALPVASNDYLVLNTELRYRANNINLSFSYIWSRSTGNFEGALKSDIIQAGAAITQYFDFPALYDGD